MKFFLLLAICIIATNCTSKTTQAKRSIASDDTSATVVDDQYAIGMAPNLDGYIAQQNTHLLKYLNKAGVIKDPQLLSSGDLKMEFVQGAGAGYNINFTSTLGGEKKTFSCNTFYKSTGEGIPDPLKASCSDKIDDPSSPQSFNIMSTALNLIDALNSNELNPKSEKIQRGSITMNLGIERTSGYMLNYKSSVYDTSNKLHAKSMDCSGPMSPETNYSLPLYESYKCSVAK